MLDKKPDRIIIISTPGTDVSSYLERLQSLQDLDVIMMLNDAPPSGLPQNSLSVLGAETSVQKIIKWHDDMEFLAEEEKSLQPTNPYFGKEKWKKNRKH